ncbi:hypothetical protein C2G38_2140349 [Gigaspora rosea]|uniref:GDP-fucose protein O-fucosyltransferase-domain-containing protein n=1 Tax=Gigaspora rosea TaxID=44941 RepID=A0A397VM97_9GLOM|nr:hypothetical protein C2G38_2140349 [Gigaspora rosea]
MTIYILYFQNQRKRYALYFILLVLFVFIYLIEYKSFLKLNDNSPIIYQEKYLTYLPHSGFNNQRIALENAIFLAWYLNRTLIVPPLLLFKGVARVTFRPYDQLYKDLNTLTKTNILHDKHVAYTMWNWEELMDFTFVKKNINYIHCQDFNFTHLTESLHINNSSEVYKVTNSYQQQYYDDPTTEHDTLFERVNLIDLRDRNEKLLHFGSLYARVKIIVQYPENQNFRSQLRFKMLINNLTMVDIVNKIINKIGGTDSFIGVHARLGDGGFAKAKKRTVQKLIKRLQEDFKHIKVNNNSFCSQTKIYLATDVKKSNSFLKPFFQTFPCTYVLTDFNDLLVPLKSLKNPRDGKIMYEFLIRFVDLLTVSKGNKFYQTENSTFSDYAKDLNKIWLDTINN